MITIETKVTFDLANLAEEEKEEYRGIAEDYKKSLIEKGNFWEARELRDIIVISSQKYFNAKKFVE